MGWDLTRTKYAEKLHTTGQKKATQKIDRQPLRERAEEIIHTFGSSPPCHNISNMQDTGRRGLPNPNQPLE